MRIVKDAEERRKEILDVAEGLFVQKGFEGTSTNEILEKVGIARGTLYYHFKSKEDIMDGIIERYSNQMIGAAKAVASDKSLPVYERIFKLVMSLNISSEGEQEILEHIHNPQNLLMHQKIEKMILVNVTPLLVSIIEDGIQQGLFDTPYPYQCMEMVITYINTILDGNLVAITDEERYLRVEALIFHIERMLGAKSGSFNYGMAMFGREGEEHRDDKNSGI